jgi:hypothetical protein
MNHHVNDKINFVLNSSSNFDDALLKILPLKETSLNAMNFRDLLTLYNALVCVPDVADLLVQRLTQSPDDVKELNDIVSHIVLYDLCDEPMINVLQKNGIQAELTEWDFKKLLYVPLMQELRRTFDEFEMKDQSDAFYIIKTIYDKSAKMCLGLCHNTTKNGNLFCSQDCWSLYHTLHHV